MSKLKFLRFVSITQIISVKHDKLKYPGLLQQLAKRFMSTSVSPQELEDKKLFLDTLPGIVDNIIASPNISHLPEIGDWLKKMLDHNLNGGHYAKGLTTMNAYEMLEKPENITEENLKLSRVLGWCIEMMQGLFCMVDDIMDNSVTRRGAPCWYRMPNIGMGATNDALLISCCITETLLIYFQKTPHFNHLVKLFHEALFYSCIGQHVDFSMAKHNTKQDYSTFTIERYLTYSPYKSSHFSFRLPVLLAYTLAKDVDHKVIAQLDDISVKLGYLYQMQDDYIDCYGDEALTGKTGSDIQEGKCSWLAVMALKHCNEAQRERFTKYYGSMEPERVAQIKTLYNELQISDIYQQKETEVHDEIVRCVRALPSGRAINFYMKVLNRLYKRDSSLDA